MMCIVPVAHTRLDVMVCSHLPPVSVLTKKCLNLTVAIRSL